MFVDMDGDVSDVLANRSDVADNLLNSGSMYEYSESQTTTERAAW